MPTILITNDDGIDSPTLVPLARCLRRLGTIRVVVPEAERSWIAKAITRFEALRVVPAEREGIAMHAVTGTPADCVSLGVHTLFDGPPDLVVSGINLGLNYGLAFLLSSGTVGAALEACLAGIPAIAFSERGARQPATRRGRSRRRHRRDPFALRVSAAGRLFLRQHAGGCRSGNGARHHAREPLPLRAAVRARSGGGLSTPVSIAHCTGRPGRRRHAGGATRRHRHHAAAPRAVGVTAERAARRLVLAMIRKGDAGGGANSGAE
jgi:hypothetical protein